MATKYPTRVRLNYERGCRNCGHQRGLGAVYWWTIKFCCRACKLQFQARWWRDFRERYLPRFLFSDP